MDKPRLGFWQIWNMSFGFLGIQFGWGLQMANMSAIYEYLGAKPDQIPMLWLAAPLTGLIVQPIIGSMSDRTWGPLGRRRPYFLVGAILSSLALILMPNSSTLWMAAGLLWILDACINISMEPFRAFVADMLPEDQRTQGFAMQSLFIGLGAVVASALPWILTNWLGGRLSSPAAGAIPMAVKLSFYVGSAAFLGAVLWTIVTHPRVPARGHERVPAPRRRRGSGSRAPLARSSRRSAHMPETMRRLAPVQMCTWFGLFCMWLYFPVAVARNVFGAPDETSPLYKSGVEWAGLCFAMYSAVCFAFSFVLPADRAEARPQDHPLALPRLRRARPALRGRHPPSLAADALDGRGRHRVGEHPLHALRDPRGLPAPRPHRGVHGNLQLLHRDPRDRGLAVLRLGHAARAREQSAGRRGRGGRLPADRRRSGHRSVSDDARPASS